jgi:hypothetical protein
LVMPFEARVAARRNAPFHVQLELAKLPAQPRPGKEVQIEGRVVRVFRGGAALQLGALMVFPLWVCESGEEPTGPAYVYYKDLVAASHMEVYLYGTPPRCRLAAYEYVLLKEPSLDARMSVEELLEIMKGWKTSSTEPPARGSQPMQETKRWWQFWRRFLT